MYYTQCDTTHSHILNSTLMTTLLLKSLIHYLTISYMHMSLLKCMCKRELTLLSEKYAELVKAHSQLATSILLRSLRERES